MRLGIVGHGADKFTPETAREARNRIATAIVALGATTVISGRSPMGGVDIWAEEQAEAMNIPTMIFPARVGSWAAIGGFKERNLKIASNSDKVVVIVARDLPPGYTGRRFKTCYHCRGRNPEHVKSGACWTAWKAKDRLWVILP